MPTLTLTKIRDAVVVIWPWVKKKIGRSYALHKAIKKSLGFNIGGQSFEGIYNQALYDWEQEDSPIKEQIKLFNTSDARRSFHSVPGQESSTEFMDTLNMLVHIDPKYEILRTPNFDLQNAIDSFIEKFKNALQQSRSPQDAEHFKLTMLKLDTLIARTKEPEIPDFTAGLETETNYIPRTYSSFEDLSSKNPFFTERRRESLMNIAEANKLIVIIGNGGTGKSVDMRKLAVTVNNNPQKYRPIYKELILINGESMADFLPSGWDGIQDDQLMLILDGLDEVPVANYTSATLEIQKFAESHKQAIIIVSCRTMLYTLPFNGLNGTLKGFSVFEINDLTLDEAKQYAVSVFAINGDQFVEDSGKHGLLDLITKPFFLKELLVLYKAEERYPPSRSNIFSKMVDNIFTYEQNHFGNTLDYDIEKLNLKPLVIRVALCMEMLGKNTITHEELHKLFKNKADEKLLKFCPALVAGIYDNKKYYQFVHNNIQELLAATYISQLSFPQLIELITIHPSTGKINPYWVNTIAFLFSILGKNDPILSQLTEWIIEKKQQELLIQFEKEKIPEETRRKLFMQIYEDYRNRNISSYSQITCKHLAVFGESKETVDLILTDISDSASLDMLTSALCIVRYFTEMTSTQKGKAQQLLLPIIHQSEDEYIIDDAINALSELRLTNKDNLTGLTTQFLEEKRNSIRMAIYHALLNSPYAEDFIDYFIKGWEMNLTGQLNSPNSVYSVGDTLVRGLSVHTKVDSIGKILQCITTDPSIFRGSNLEDVLKATIANAIILYSTHREIYDLIIELTDHFVNYHLDNEIRACLNFYEKTNTREWAFDHFCKEEKLEQLKYCKLLALLTSPKSSFEKIGALYKENQLTRKTVLDYNYALSIGLQTKDFNAGFEDYLKEKTDIIIEKPERIDYNAMRHQKMITDFALLFDKDAFIQEVYSVYVYLKKETIFVRDLYELGTEYNADGICNFHASILKLIRDYSDNYSGLTKQESHTIIADENRFEPFRMRTMQEYLHQNTTLTATREQIDYIGHWCQNILAEVDFYNSAIDIDCTISFGWKATCLSFFTKKFDFDFPETVFLDMLAFDGSAFGCADIDFISLKVDKSKIQERILDNLRSNRIKQPSVIINHVKYILFNKIEEGYGIIERLIISDTLAESTKLEVLKDYISRINNLPTLQQLFEQCTSFDYKWEIIKEMKKQFPDTTVLTDYLEALLDTEQAQINKLNIASLLTELQNIKGLLFLKEYFISEHSEPFILHMSYSESIKKYSSFIGIDALFELNIRILKRLATGKLVKETDWRYLQGCVSDAIFQIALQSAQNFEAVKNKYELLSQALLPEYPEAKYISNTIYYLEDQYYRKVARSVTFKDVLQKLNLLET